MGFKRKKNTEKGFSARVVIMGLLFIVASVYYITRLAGIQITNRSEYTSSVQKTYTRTVTIQAQRGEIFDRNGNPLVKNLYSYDLVFDYGSFSRVAVESNDVILGVIKGLSETGNESKRTESNFPFLGSYPNLIYDENLMGDEKFAAKHKRALKALGLYEDKNGNPIEYTADELITAIAKKYKLITIDKHEKITENYDPETITELLRVRYDMAFAQFSTAEPFVFAKDVELALITYIKENDLRGATFSENVTREYVYPGYASHILGRVGQIHAEDLEYYSEKGYKMNAVVGISGCEQAFEEYLHGTDGTMLIEEDENGYIISQSIKKEPISGGDVWLTIDIDIQKAAEDGLKDNIDYIVKKALATKGDLDGEDASAGAITAVEVSTGAVLAIASYPTYDLSDFDYASLAADEATPMLNRTLMGQYQPGSTFKIGVAAAALEEGIITPNTYIKDLGRYTYYDANGPRCWIYLKNGRTHGTINVVEAIQESCNYFFYDIGRQLTISKINKYSRFYGLGEHTGIELSEYTGILAGPDYRKEAGLGEWYPGDTLQAAIGQSDNLFTPLQISCYISTLVGGGTRYSAHLLDSVRKFYTNEIIYKYEPKVLGTVTLSDTTYKTIMTAMKGVTENGSASRLFRDYPIAMGGKTGTAQVSTKKSDNAIFTAFAPFDNPEIVATCVIEQGNSGTDAGFTVKNVFDCYFGLGEFAKTDEGAAAPAASDGLGDVNVSAN